MIQEAKERVKEGKEIKKSRSMNILYVAPDIPIPHTGEFVGGSTHVFKVAESLSKKGNNVIILSRRVS